MRRNRGGRNTTDLEAAIFKVASDRGSKIFPMLPILGSEKRKAQNWRQKKKKSRRLGMIDNPQQQSANKDSIRSRTVAF